MRRIVTFMLCAILVLTCLPLTVMQADAAYENTYKNTGDQRADIIGVALTQVGYMEGSNNYTKYGVWFGHSNMAWCGAFVSWCANQAGIPSSVLKKNGFASASSFGLSNTFKAASRLPQSGDLFFKDNGNHTGLVYYVSGDYFYTLEGNTWENDSSKQGVYIRKRKLHDAYYFASPNYNGANSHSHTYETKVESAHPHKEYQLCTSCNAKSYTGNTSKVADCKECIMASCSHSYGSYTKYNATYHKATCKHCGYVAQVKHSWGNDKVIKEATCKTVGTKQQTCSVCGETKTVDIPKNSAHSYGEWMYKDETVHCRTCTSCDHVEEKKHTPSKTYGADAASHWRTCSDCMGRIGVESHKRGSDSCDAPCKTCSYKESAVHEYAQQWAYDENSHWHTCLHCSAVEAKAAHTYSADCDESCDECGYIRETVHNWGAELHSDKNGHWSECDDCGQKSDVLSHNPGSGATEDHAQLCKDCGFEMVPVLTHVLTAMDYSHDENTHWLNGTNEAESHNWDIESGKCTVCGMPAPTVQGAVEIPWMIVLPAVAGACMLSALLIALSLIHKRKKALVPA